LTPANSSILAIGKLLDLGHIGGMAALLPPAPPLSTPSVTEW